MPTVQFDDLQALVATLKAHVHGVPFQILLADNPNRNRLGFHCTHCDLTWNAPVTTRLQLSSHLRSIFDSLESRKKFAESLSVASKETASREPPAKTAHERLMAEDAF